MTDEEKTKDIEFTSNEFEYSGKKYDCSLAIKKDIKDIITEAKSHKDFAEYDEESLRPNKVRFFFIDDKPVYCMIIYTIDYRDWKNGRYACGNYYPLFDNGVKTLVMPHPYQGSICW